MIHHFRVVCAICCGCIFCVGGVAMGQGPGGGFNPDDFFNRLDRNGNGQIDPEEMQNSPMRAMFERSGRDVSRPITKADFQEMQQQMMQRFRSGGMRGGPPGGPPPGGPPGGVMPTTPPAGSTPPPSDAGDSGGDRRRGRGRRDRGGANGGASTTDTPAPPNGTAPAAPDAKSAGAKPPAVRQRLQLDLPEQYSSRDANRDGQIGLYEWPKNDFATFKRLDLNGDGFVTPHELERENRRKAPPTTQVAAVVGGSAAPPAEASDAARGSPPTSDRNSGSADSGRGRSRRSRSGGGSEGGDTAGTAAPSADKAEDKAGEKSSNPAETAFDALDRDKDGQLTEEEWQRSVKVRSIFERADIAVTLPLAKSEFLRLYPKNPN